MPSLASRRKTTDLILTFKLLHNLIDVSAHGLGVELAHGITRSSGVDIKVRRAATELVKKTFNFRVAGEWNSLPVTTKTTASLPAFISKIG